LEENQLDYNTEFQSNNNDLQEILNTLSDLPTYEDIVAEHNINPIAHADLLSTKANAEDLTDHINDTSVHVNAEEKEKIANIGLIMSDSLVTHDSDLEAHNELFAQKANSSDITVKYEGDKLYGLIDNAWQELVIKSQPTRASIILDAASSNIAIPQSITSLECVDVYQNGLLLSENINYTLDTTNNTITLADYTADAGDVFVFVAY
jgi:hypothetical protein